ncbi:uncharacterized protein METZ01_LOCUS250107 [marine metagenome]|uniref:Uncharacterized protein n=1 Tax=marine metagenome TaxID=408172 RepID=A0A382IED9_9ZZZZ
MKLLKRWFTKMGIKEGGKKKQDLMVY